MTKILFVCHGNICRSAMAECVFLDLAEKAGKSAEFAVNSAATSREELGNPLYPPAARKLREKGVPIVPHRARQMTAADYREYDLLVGMDFANIRNMERLAGGDAEGKIRLLLSFAGEAREVADPWYTDDFESTYRDVVHGCAAILREYTK